MKNKKKIAIISVVAVVFFCFLTFMVVMNATTTFKAYEILFLDIDSNGEVPYYRMRYYDEELDKKYYVEKAYYDWTDFEKVYLLMSRGDDYSLNAYRVFVEVEESPIKEFFRGYKSFCIKKDD